MADNSTKETGNSFSNPTMEELRLVIPKETARKFRAVAKATRTKSSDLFVEMIEAYSIGVPLGKGK